MPNWFFDPTTTLPRRLADRGAEMVDPTLGPEDKGFLRPFAAGAMQGAGDVMSEMTSPFSLATMAVPAASKLLGVGRSAMAANAGAKASAIMPKSPMGGWGSIFERAPKYARMAENVGAAERAAMPIAESGVGASEEIGQMLNKIYKTEKAMDRTKKIETARQRALRLRPSRFFDE